eukprot:comp21388_c0_seq1/m.29437 comp21388_c0_seq1/g.29437  ORF comp21388_c0_seq1/g.29437 comp21388_c0_seq1/m.29437 type:complete len:181 (-) comp21388_c0_seq1:949-1491(-)
MADEVATDALPIPCLDNEVHPRRHSEPTGLRHTRSMTLGNHTYGAHTPHTGCLFATDTTEKFPSIAEDSSVSTTTNESDSTEQHVNYNRLRRRHSLPEARAHAPGCEYKCSHERVRPKKESPVQSPDIRLYEEYFEQMDALATVVDRAPLLHPSLAVQEVDETTASPRAGPRVQQRQAVR